MYWVINMGVGDVRKVRTIVGFGVSIGPMIVKVAVPREVLLPDPPKVVVMSGDTVTFLQHLYAYILAICTFMLGGSVGNRIGAEDSRFSYHCPVWLFNF